MNNEEKIQVRNRVVKYDNASMNVIKLQVAMELLSGVCLEGVDNDELHSLIRKIEDFTYRQQCRRSELFEKITVPDYIDESEKCPNCGEPLKYSHTNDKDWVAICDKCKWAFERLKI